MNLENKIFDEINKLGDKISQGWNKFRNGLLNITKVLDEIGFFVYEQIENTNKFYLILSKINWPPPYDGFIPSNINDVNRFVELYDKKGISFIKKDVNRLMQNWHSQSIIDKILNDWKSLVWLHDRLPILQDAILAHKDGLYTLSIPTLIPQVEGILVDNLRITGHMDSKKFKQYIESLLHPALIIKNKNMNIKDFVANTLLTKFILGSGDIVPFSRHSIAHGANISYATQSNSLKVILLINSLNKLLHLVALTNSNIYHLNGCPSIKYSKVKRIFFSSMLEASQNGYEICKRCGKKQGEFLLF